MNKDYIIQEISNKDTLYLIIPCNYNSSLNLIFKSISNIKLKDGKILVDQIITKGSNENRFLELHIRNNRIDVDHYRYIKPDKDITNFSYSLIKRLPESIKNSIYPKSIRDEINKI